MAKGVELSNGRSWTYQKQALEHFREIRGRYVDGTAIDDAQDHDDLAALAERFDAAHPEEGSKIGAGIGHFEVRTNHGSGGPTRGFWLVRVDGSETDFSFIWAVRGIPKPASQEFADACRAAVLADLKAAKRVFFAAHADGAGRVPCELTGVLLSADEAHVDHADPTFGAIVIGFRAARGWRLDVPAGTLSCPGDAQLTTTFADCAVAEAFRAYHYRLASLRIVSQQANLSRPAGDKRAAILRPVVLAAPGL